MQVKYRVTDLGALGFNPNPDEDGTLGINDKGEVAFSRMVGGQRHAQVWLPRAAYGLTPGSKDVEGLFSFAAHPSIAREINEAGQLVGQINGLVVNEGQGVVWDLALVSRNTIGFLPGGGWSRGMSINLTGKVAGQSEGSNRFCSPCASSGPFADVLRSFTWPPMAELGLLLNCPLGVQENTSGVNDIADSGLTVGFSDKNWIAGSDCIETCSTSAVYWTASGVIQVLPDLGPGLPSEARGVSADGARIVGWGSDKGFHLDTCLPQQALYWEGLSMTVLRTDSRAEAVNSQTLPEVVGWDDEDGAVHWRRNGAGTWDTTLLTGAINTGALGIGFLAQAHDINEDGWIVTWGLPSGSSNPHAYVLTPLGTCPADITGPPGGSGAPPDGKVDTVDFLEVQMRWGPCPPGQYWPADVNGDGTVNTVDFLAVINAWGPCP